MQPFNMICVRLQNTIELRTQPQNQGTWMQPFHSDLQTRACRTQNVYPRSCSTKEPWCISSASQRNSAPGNSRTQRERQDAKVSLRPRFRCVRVSRSTQPESDDARNHRPIEPTFLGSLTCVRSAEKTILCAISKIQTSSWIKHFDWDRETATCKTQ